MLVLKGRISIRFARANCHRSSNFAPRKFCEAVIRATDEKTASSKLPSLTTSRIWRLRPTHGCFENLQPLYCLVIGSRNAYGRLKKELRGTAGHCEVVEENRRNLNKFFFLCESAAPHSWLYHEKHDKGCSTSDFRLKTFRTHRFSPLD